MAPAVTFQHHADLAKYQGDQSSLEFVDRELSTNLDSTNAFEGPEKLLEVWISPSADSLPFNNGKTLRDIPISGIETMLDLVNCKILSKKQSPNVDAYLLSESSLFVFKYKMILKTCGTTTTLFCLDRLNELINTHCGEFSFKNDTFRVFYSRRAFMFPQMQELIHQSWDSEVEYLNRYFDTNAHEQDVLGELNGDHWYIYINGTDNGDEVHHSTDYDNKNDLTIEMLMTGLDENNCKGFQLDAYPRAVTEDESIDEGHRIGREMICDKGLDQLYHDAKDAKHDSFAFNPCGFSSNSLLAGDHYYTLHITPESGWSYASFESTMDNLQALQRVAESIKPLKFVLTICFEHGDFPIDQLHIPGYEQQQFIKRKLKWYNVIYSYFVKPV